MNWAYLPSQSLPAVGGGVTINVAPTQLIAAFSPVSPAGGRSGRSLQFEFVNDDAANTVTVTLYQSPDSSRQNMNPIVIVIGPQQSERVRLDVVADLFFWATATSSAGTSLVRTAVLGN